MDTRLSCLIWGTIGVIFGLLALLFPELLMGPVFYGIFLIIAGLAIAILLFLAITSRGDESMFWFGLSSVILVVVVLSFLVELKIIIENIFLFIVAGIAFYNGFISVTLGLTHPKTKYILVPGMFIAALLLLAGLLWYFPALSDNLVMVILGNFAFVFGLVSILMGLYQKESPEPDIADEKWTTKDKTCEYHKPVRKE